METRAHYVLIGFFTVFIASAVLLFSLWLTKSGSDSQYKYYDVVFNEAVIGLSQGSIVQYSGIKVGDITKLKLDPENPNKVWARIRVAALTPIRQDTQAKLTPTGITGSAIVQLSSGKESSPLLNSKDGEIPVIVAVPSSLNKLLANGEDMMTNINHLISSLNDLTSSQNITRVNNTLANLEQITSTVNNEKKNIQTTMQQLTQASKQANQLTHNANNLLNTQGKQLLSDATKTMASLEKTSATLNKLLQENQGSINNGLQGMDELGPALKELNKTLGSLRKITNRLEENPAAYLLGQEKPKEFTPQ